MALADIGYYLLWAIGLILLLILIISAAALLLIRIDLFAKFKFSNDVLLKKIRLLINFLFLKYNAFEVDDFEDDIKVKQMSASQKSESKMIEKSACYVTKTGEKIKIKTIQSQEHWDVYDVVIEISDKGGESPESEDETLVSAEEADEISVPAEGGDEPSSKEETDETSVPTEETNESSLEEETDETSVPTEETNESSLKEETDEQITHKSSVSEDSVAADEETDSKDTESEEDKSFLNDLDDLSDAFDDIQMYVDLSNPKQFISDSLTAASKISISGSRLIGALLLRTNIKKLSFNLDYGLSGPAGTAILYGVIQSFISGINAYLDSVSKRSRSSYRRRRSKEIVSHIQNNVFITPKLTEKKINLESEVSVSFWIIRFYLPMIRFLINRNTRWVLRRYVWVYYIKHYLKNKMRKKPKQKEASVNAALQS